MTITSQSVDRIRAEQARSLFRNCPLGVISAAVVAAMLAAALATTGRLDVTRAVVWSGMIAGCALAHIGLCVLFWRARPADRAWRKWLFWFTAVAALEGASWFVGAVWMASPHDFSQELIVLLVASAVASGGVPVFGTYQPAFLAFMIPTILVHVGIALYYPYPLHFLLAALEGAYLILMPLVARGFGGQFVDGLRLRFENMDLVEDLRLQKTLAEQANLAKSSFLAAASHDLRQPVHALGLFIGALRARAMDEEARRLVDHIDGSVTAMDDLFASLLDISKLDAGVVEPRLEPVAVGLLLRRLCDDHAEEAAAKGLVMRVVAGHAWVWSDPVLLERILRNVVANALCYTDAGRVLIGCRRAPGSVTVEVWDTGRGIARDQRDLIFQEFYQVGNPERDRSKGLGLGLAIVKRMTALIDATLTFRSALGRGSVFRLTLDRCAPASVDADDHAPIAAFSDSGGLILVIDDERAVQEAMRSLLSSWGYAVVVAGSAAEMARRLRDRPARPDLIICDYRLREGENGIEVIDDLRRRYDHPVAALLVTGDTAPDRLNEARASGLVLLHKPVSNSKLRAAVGNLMRGAGA